MAVVSKNLTTFRADCSSFAKRYPDHEAARLIEEAEKIIEELEEQVDAGSDLQPVGQEPVAVVGSDFTIQWVGSGPIARLVERHGIKRGSLLYAAPQPSIDLGQFRESVEFWKAWSGIVKTKRTQEEYVPRVAEADRLLALIDGQRDAANGEEVR